MRKYIAFIMLQCVFIAQAQQRQVQRATVAFMNVENLWDTIASADYIDGTLPKTNPAFHRSIPVDSIKHLEVTEDYKGEWSDDLLKGKKVVRYQAVNDEFTPKSPKRWNSKL